MAGMIFRVDTFFKGTDKFDQIFKIVKCLGEDELNEYLTKYGLTLPPEVKKLMKGQKYPKIPWENYISDKNKHLVSPEAIDLVGKMLKFDKNERIRPKEAMKHPYFEPILGIIKEQEENGIW